MTRKACKRKLRPLTAPRLPLTEKHCDQLALQAHAAFAQIDSEAGLQAFVNVLTVLTVALEADNKHCDYSRLIIRSGLHALDKIIKTGIITDNQQALLARLTTLIDEWCATRLTYRGLLVGKKAVKGL